MTKDDRDVVSAVREALAGRVGTDRYELWFAPRTRIDVRGKTAVVEVGNRFSLEWLREQFVDEIRDAARSVLGDGAEISFVVDSSVGRAAAAQSVACGPAAAGDTPAPRDGAVDLRVVAGDTPGRDSAARRNQRPLAGFDSFVVGDGNRVAIKAAEMVASRPGEMTPLLIHGPHGAGKTHLLEGICDAVRRSNPAKRCVYLSAEQFTSLFLEALHGTGLPSFRRKYRGVGLLILDDVQFFVGKKATLVEVLHTIDTLLRQGQQLVLAADRPPVELVGLGGELTNRMASGVVCGIAPPDQPTRLGIARRWAGELQVNVPPDALRWVAQNVTGDARLLRGAVNRLRATSMALEQPVSRQMAEQHLGDLVQVSSCLVRLADVERAVCRVFELDSKSLRSTRKFKGVSQPRMLAMWLARKYTRAGFSEISEHFGRRSHSSAACAHRRVTDWIDQGATIEGPCGIWKAEDAVRKVERLLRRA